MSLRPGDAVEHFVIVSSLGEGGMGQVYLARDTRLQRSIALKIMQPEVEGDASSPTSSNGAARLLREAQSAAGLEHPNVVTIYEVGEIKGEGEEAGRPFIAMELVKGKALRAFIGDESVPMKERVRWLVDTARALAAAHKAGLVHRDIKPENVMVREDGVVKVLDFGLAKRAASGPASVSSSTEAQVLPSLTGKGIAIGTPYYMAPEQMRREPLDGRADQFAWGVVAYELLSGLPAWGRDVDALELVSKLLSEDPAPLAQMRPDVPPHVAAAVTRAMSKRKGARFETTDELIGALGDESGALDETIPGSTLKELGLSPPSRPIPVVPSAPSAKTSARPPPRSRVPRWLLAAAVVAASALAAIAAFKRAPSKAPPVVASASAAPRECAHNAECVAKVGGKPAVCNPSGRCAAIESEDCKATYDPDDLRRDDTVWFGAMYPLTGDDASFGVPEARAVELARQDFASLRGALEGTRGARSLGLVTCDDVVAPQRAAHHLVDDVGVPAILGFRTSAELMDLAGSLFIPRRVLAVSALNTSPLITQIPEPPDLPRLVWRTTYNIAAMAAPLARFVEQDLEPRARAAKTPTDSIRAALLRTRTTGSLAFAHALVEDLSLNAARAIDNGRDSFREIVVEQGSADSAKAAVLELTHFAPDIVVYVGGDDMIRDIVEPFESALRARRVAPPTYVTMSVLAPELLAWAGGNPERRRRFFGLTTRSDTTANAHFVMHYNESSPQKMSRSASPNGSYDAFYVVAYASYAAEDGAITGPSLARAIARLVPPGTPVEVGPTHGLEAIQALRRGANIDLEGATGKLDFDLARGEAPVDFVVLCVAASRNDRGPENVESGLTYDSTTKTLAGALRCP